MTCTELELALEQQQAENAALRAQLAQAKAGGWAASSPLLGKEQMVRLMEELAPAVVLADIAGGILWVSEGFTALCGFELHEVLGRNAASMLRPNLQAGQALDYLRASMQARQPFTYEVPNPRPDVVAGWIRVKVQFLHDAAGEAMMMVGMVEDVTEWKKTQLTLDESERRFQALAENTPGVLYQWRKNWDGTFQFGYVSPKLYELFGIRVEEIDRMPKFIHPDDLASFRASIVQAVQARGAWSFAGRVVVEGQPMRWLQGNSAVTDIDATGIKYSGILQDITPLKQAETALRESEIRWRLAVEGFGDGAWEMNLQSRHIFYSPDYKAMLGYQDDEFSNEYSTWLEHVHPDDLPGVKDIMATHLHGDAPLGVAEYRIRCKDGAYKWVLGRAMVTARDANGAACMLTGLQTDITELKKAQSEAEESGRRLATVIANLPEGLVLEDENRHIMLTNDAFCLLLPGSFTPASLMGKDGTWLAEKSVDFMRNPVQYAARITALLRRRQMVVGDVLKLRDGRVIRRDFTPIYDHERYIGQLWKFEDISARAKEEEKLKRSEEKYRGIIENMSLGLVEADLNDHLIFANQSFCDMTGFCNDQLAGRRLSPLLLTGGDLELVESKLETRQLGIADSYEVAITTRGGDMKWMLVSGAPLYDNDRQHVGSIGIYLDVTPQKHLEANLREAKALAEVSTRAKQDFLANMSHEIRTPMNAILGMSQLLAKTKLAGPQASYLRAITTSAENLLVIINDILDLSKIEAGRLTMEHIGFSLAQLHVQVEKTLLYKAEEKGLSFTTHLGPGVPAVLLGDPYRITQILLNLAGNSVKFTEHGSVSVACSLVRLLPDGEALVEFVVGDTGIGMEASYLAQLFDNFSQEDSSVTRKFGGTGLGLGISKKLVGLLGGELLITSRKNWGTTSRFSLRLPVGTAADLPRKEAGPDLSSLRHRLRGKRVLLVEDNDFNRMLAGVILANSSLNVTEAANGEIAVALAKNHSFDLILMDVQMPVMDGYDATRLIRQQSGPSVPIIALTANAISGEREKCLAVGMNDYLTKPFQEASLLKMVYDWVLGPLK